MTSGIALLGADHRQPDAGVAARGLHHGLAGPQPAVAFRRLDDAERDAVLDRAQRVEGLDLDEHLDALGCARWLMRTTGVLPMVARMEGWMADMMVPFLLSVG